MAIFTNRILRLSDDPYLAPHMDCIRQRKKNADMVEWRLTGGTMSLEDFACGHEYFGLHFREDKWIFREWAPNAIAIYLVGDFSAWKESPKFALKRINNLGHWELTLDKNELKHGDLYRLNIHWSGGFGERIPAYARRVVQDRDTNIFSAQIWKPEKPYSWKNKEKLRPFVPLIYECHVGMAQEKEGIGSYNEFRLNILPRIIEAGYNTIQLMAIMEHPYYGSMGYHVSSFFAASSRFGTPEDLKALIDDAHGAGLAVIMDLIHSHAANNENEGISRFDGTLYQYFHDGDRGKHIAWDSRCFDYGKVEVLHFLLSNCRFWLDEYRLDGFRFDGVTSMLYYDHGLGPGFNSYNDYFDTSRVDEDAVIYLTLANKLIHKIKSEAISIAEDVSGMPGLCAPIEDCGVGFDYRLAMGVPDAWFKLLKEVPDEKWNMDWMWHEFTNRRTDEKTINYAESHDQSIVGGKTIIFQLIDAEMYSEMNLNAKNIAVERGIALHKMIRLLTLAASSHGYLNFIGNEFGHPEWVDFPRAGNNWSYKYAKRQWHLRDDRNLKYHFLADFDKAIIKLARKERFIENSFPQKLYSHCDNQILAVRRGQLIFIFNFHPFMSFPEYYIDGETGIYKLILNTDETRFGGQGRIAPGQEFSSLNIANGRQGIKVYIPCRTAIVLRQENTR